MDFRTAVQTCFRKYATFQGRARRSEFWYFWLFIVLGTILAAIIDGVLGSGSDVGTGVVGGLFSLVTLLPILAAIARRLHDTGHSGWWQAASLVPAAIMGVVAGSVFPEGGEPSGLAILVMGLAGLAALVISVLVLIWLIRAGDRGPNRFGEDPMGPPIMAQPMGTPWR